MKFNWVYILYALFIFLLFIGVRIILNYLRKNTIKQLNYLLYGKENFILYQELLNNRRLRLIFRKEMIDILRLNGYLLEGKKQKINELFSKLDKVSLEPYEKLEYYQKRFSYYVEKGDKEEANKSLLMLKNIFKKTKKLKYINIIEEAELVYDIYILHNTKLIPKLIDKMSNTNNRIIKGIIQYRIAKLHYYDNNHKQVDKYLDMALENVKGTYWYPIIIEAQKNHQVLDKK